MVNHSAPDKSSILSVVRAVGSVADGATLRRLPEMGLPALCDVVEYRVDTWPEHTAEALEQAQQSAVPVHATVRRPEEGGQNALSVAERLRLARLFLPVVQLLDVEIASLEEMPGLVQEARAMGVTVVASWHDLAGTPPLEVLQRKRDAGIAAGADMVKFAATLHSAADI